MDLSFGAADAWNAACYGEKHTGTVEFLRSQFDTISNFVTEAGKNFYQKSLSAFNHYNGTDALRFARNVISNMSGGEIDRIYEIRDLSGLQNANLQMQRWIMANPVVRQRYMRQECDGYSDTYFDAHPGKIGKDHYDYRMATTGMLQFDEKTGAACFTEYAQDLADGDRRLLFEEKCDIANTWDVTNVIFAIGEDDATSKDGGKL